jgi:hypothetical protein
MSFAVRLGIGKSYGSLPLKDAFAIRPQRALTSQPEAMPQVTTPTQQFAVEGNAVKHFEADGHLRVSLKNSFGDCHLRSSSESGSKDL